MPRGSKKSYTSKQRRAARNIEGSGKKRGKSVKRAASMAYATVNAQDGGKKSGSGRGHRKVASSSRKGGVKGGRAAARRGDARGSTRRS